MKRPPLGHELTACCLCSRPLSEPRPAPSRAGLARYYRQAKERLGANRACLSVARKLLKRSYHTLRELGAEALEPA